MTSSRRILYFLQPGNTSRHYAVDMIRGLQESGHTVTVLELEPIWRRLSGAPAPQATDAARLEVTRQVGSFIKSARVDLTIAMWGNALTTLTHALSDTTRDAASPPRGISCFDLWRIPHLMYWLDAPQWAQGGSVRSACATGIFAGSHLASIVNNSGSADEMTRLMGFRHAGALPYAIHPGTFHPENHRPARQREFDLAIAIGPGDEPPTPFMLEQLAHDEPDVDAIRREAAWGHASRSGPESDRAAVEPPHGGSAWSGAWRAIATHASPDHAGPLRQLAHALIDSQLADPHVPLLERLDAMVRDAGAPAHIAETSRLLTSNLALWLDLSAAVRRVDSWRRAFVAAHLSRRLRCVVFGQGDLSAWGVVPASVGYVAHDAQRAWYARARLGLSVMRWQDDVGINLKPLEMTASGTACLAHWRRGIAELLEPGREIVTALSPGELLSRAREMLARPDAIDGVAQAGLVRVRREHTWAQRIPALLGTADAAIGR